MRFASSDIRLVLYITVTTDNSMLLMVKCINHQVIVYT